MLIKTIFMALEFIFISDLIISLLTQSIGSSLDSCNQKKILLQGYTTESDIRTKFCKTFD